MYKRLLLIFILFAPLSAKPTEVINATGTIEIAFSPRGGATRAIINALREAQQTILVQAYSFTSPAIARALVDAHERGVKVRVILDKSQRTERYTGATYLKNHGIPVYIDAQHAIAHNKVMIIDQKVLITGSFNFTKAAEGKNAENLLIFRNNNNLVEAYINNYQKHFNHSDIY